MRRIHSEDDVLAVCREIIEQEGPEGLTRDAVQAALKARAERLGQRPVGADHRVVGEVLERVREEMRQSRVGAARAANGAATTPLPDAVTATLGRLVSEVEHACRQAVATTEERGRAEADARVASVEAALRGELAVTQADHLLARREAQELALQLDEVTAALEGERRVSAGLSVELAEKTAVLTVREQEAREQLGALMAQVESAHRERAVAQEVTHQAEANALEAQAALVARERELAVAAVERDLARRRVAELEDRSATLEQRVAELTERAAAATARCEELTASTNMKNRGAHAPRGQGTAATDTRPS